MIPARDEAARIVPCLEGVASAPGVSEVIVVDDGSSDATTTLARRHGARVIAAGEPAAGWVGKPWALQRGLEAARGEVVVSLDADTRPAPGLVPGLVDALRDADFVSAGARFRCETAGERWLHPAMLATLVYRFGPPDAAARARAGRLLVSGQCTAVQRRTLLAAGGYRDAAGHTTDDIALARALARRGWRIAFRSAAEVLAVDMHDSVGQTWHEWGRSIAMRDVTPAAALVADVAVVWLTLGLPPLRMIARRAGPLDRGLLILRVVMTIALAASYERRGPAYWLSPLADPAAAVRLTLSAVVRRRRWRGRVYDDARRTGCR